MATNLGVILLGNFELSFDNRVWVRSSFNHSIVKTHLIRLSFLLLIGSSSCNKITCAFEPPVDKKWVVTTIAGNGSAFYVNGPALTAAFSAPQDVAVSSNGHIYVADGLNHRIRKIAGGQVTTFAGVGMEDTTSGIGTDAGFAIPIRVASDEGGNIYTLDLHDFRVRKITTNAVVTVVAGNGKRGFADGNAEAAMFGESIGIVTDNQGNIYVSDWENKRIRKISVAGQVSTVFGPAQFRPGGIAIDKMGNLFVVDQSSLQIRKIDPMGEISTLAGNGTAGDRDGYSGQAQFSTTMGDLVIDQSGDLYLADSDRIRKITPEGFVLTIAGTTSGFNDGLGISAKFNGPVGLGIDELGNIYVAEANSNRIRKISLE